MGSSLQSITVIGNGVWGNALFTVIRKNYPSVRIWDRHSSLADEDVIVLAIPTLAIRSVLSDYPVSPHCSIVNTSKGIEADTALFPYEIVSTLLKRSPYFSLIGPSFAKEVKEGDPTVVNLGYNDPTNAQKIRRIFHTKEFHVRLTGDIATLELFAAFKNVYAIASGFAQGIGLRANTQAKITTIALEEIYHMADRLKLPISSTSLAGTIGDLVLTTYSAESRNYRFGKYLTQHTAQRALELVASTVEGYHTSFAVQRLTRTHRIRLPLAQLIYDMIRLGSPSTSCKQFREFLSSV